jgi:hypothetical protein
MARRLVIASLLSVAAILAGCGGGGSTAKVATQPNGPPKPPPPPPARIDSMSNRDKAIAAATTFAKAKYKAALDYTRPTAQCATQPRQGAPTMMPDGSTVVTQSQIEVGSWTIGFPVDRSKPEAALEVDTTTPSSPEESAQAAVGGFTVIARRFLVTPAGKVSEIASMTSRMQAPVGAAP